MTPPPPPPRRGPRPLALHMSAVLATLLSSTAGLPFLRNGLLPWKPHLRERAGSLHRHLDAVDPEALHRAVDLEMRRRFDAVLTGLERYRHHPYRRTLPDPPVIWTEGASRLLDYGGDGVPVLFVPSLVNRAYILDLSHGRSLLRWLSGQGVRPFLIDWGMPGPLERRFTLTDYIAGRLERALDAVLARAGRPAAIVGYCMGGLLALALTLRRQRDLSRLALLATPWDFHAEDAGMARRAAALLTPFTPALDSWGEMPVDIIQAQFAALDPLLVMRKFSQFGRLDPESSQARAFVALEDWLNDGVTLPAAVVHDCLAGWYGRNDTVRGHWLVAGAPVDPGGVRVPTLALIPERDRIVPPASARALARAIPGARTLAPPLGHIGMVVSAGAESGVWRPLASWLKGATVGR